MLLVYGFLTQDFIPHEKPWTRIAKSLFFNVFVTLACVSRHPPRLWRVLNELLVYGFLTRSAHVCYRTNEILMVLFLCNTSWTKASLQNRKGNYNGFSYTNSMWRHPKHERCHSGTSFLLFLVVPLKCVALVHTFVGRGFCSSSEISNKMLLAL